MWTDSPSPLVDGIVIATTITLVIAAIFSLTGTHDEKRSVSQCQEIVVNVEKHGNVLARCPTGTYIDIVDNNVVCRCGVRRDIEQFKVDVTGELPDEPSPPKTETPLVDDDKSIDL